MFFIVNKTKQNIVLSDLKITLGPRQAIDLDRMVDRNVSDASKFLRAAISKGQIEVRVKDGIENSYQVKKDVPKDSNLEKIKQEIIQEIKQGIKEIASGISPVQVVEKKSDGVTKEDLNRMAEIIIKSLPSSQQEKILKGEEIEIDEEILAVINAKAVNNMVKDAEVKSVHYNEKKEDDTILNNIDELEDLLG